MPSPRPLPTTSYALLGLLGVTSMSGYDLAQAADRSIANFWPISRSQVYGELSRLESLGLIRGTDVSQERLPDKRVFEVTDEGDQALKAWLAIPGYEAERYRIGFCVKMFFGHHMPRETMIENLQRFRDDSKGRSEYLGQIVDMLSAMPEAAFVAATARLGLRLCETAREWAEEMLSSLPSVDHPDAAAEHEKIHEQARELFKKVPPRVERSRG